MGYVGQTITDVFPTSISVDTATIATANISNQLTDANMSAGSVLQVVQGTYTSNDSFSGSTFQNIGLQVNITPTATSSKILINAQLQMGYPTQNAGATLTFLRGSTNLASTARPGFAHIGDSTSGDQRTYQMLMISMQFLDSPSSTSQITYSVGISMDTGTGYFNRNRNNDSGSKGTSIITVMEIAG
jgi:hypothetical protein|tara:strand:- start:351 stop:911 length:561 start_codon:yes stop_codon:yes gene_type:complete